MYDAGREHSRIWSHHYPVWQPVLYGRHCCQRFECQCHPEVQSENHQTQRIGQQGWAAIYAFSIERGSYFRTLCEYVHDVAPHVYPTSRALYHYLQHQFYLVAEKRTFAMLASANIQLHYKNCTIQIPVKY